MPPQFSFIITTGHPLRDGKVRRKLVRSHVTAVHYQEKRGKDVEEYNKHKRDVAALALKQKQPSSLHDSTHISYLQYENNSTIIEGARQPAPENINTNSFDLSTPSGVYLAFIDTLGDADDKEISDIFVKLLQPVSPWSRLGQGGDDPFFAAPLFITTRMQKHLYYYVNVLKPRMNPSWPFNVVRRRFGCSGMLFTDPMLLYAACATSSTARAVETGHRRPLNSTKGETVGTFHRDATDWLYYKGKTIEAVNEKLSSGAEVSENIISVICDLILLEAYTGNLNDAKIHMSGLKRILILRPNLNELSYLTAAKIASLNNKMFTLLHSKPNLPFTLRLQTLPLPIPNVDQLLPRLGSKLVGDQALIHFDEATSEALVDLIRMTKYTEAVFNGLFPWAQDDRYSDYFEHWTLSIEQRLLSKPFNSLVLAPASGVINSSCRLACILFVNTVLCNGYPESSAIILNTVKLLKAALASNEFPNLNSSWAPYNELLLWVLFIGAHSSYETDDRQFFFHSFKMAVLEIPGLSSWEDSKIILAQFFFFDRVHLGMLKQLW